MSDTTASATRIDVNPNDMSSRSAATIADAAPMKGNNPTVVMTYDLKRINAGTEKSTTGVIIQGRFHPFMNTDSKVALDEGNHAAKRSFLRSLNSPVVTAGFQCLLQTSFGDTVAQTAVTSHDPSEPVSQYLEKKLDPLCRTFGSLLGSAHALTAGSSGHVDIAPLEPSDWRRVESRHGILNRSRVSRKATEKKNVAAFRFMNNQVQWNGERSPVRGYWQNEDGSLVEIHPEVLGDPELGPRLSSNWIAGDTRSNQSTQEGSQGGRPRVAVDEGRPLHAQLCSSTSHTVPAVADRIAEGGDGKRTCEEHSHVPVPWGDGGGQGSYQPWMPEQTRDGVPRGASPVVHRGDQARLLLNMGSEERFNTLMEDSNSWGK